MRSKGSRFTLGVWGWGCVRSTLRSRPQPSATVRRAYGKFCRGGHFWRFQTSRCFVSRGRRGTSWHSEVFCITRRKSFCVAGAILLRRFQKMRCSFRGRRSTLDVSIVIFRGRRSTLDVSCWVFLQIALAGLRQVTTSCKFRGRRGILWHVLKIDGSLARNIDFEVTKFRGPYENSWENVDFEATKCENWRISRTKCIPVYISAMKWLDPCSIPGAFF